MQFPSSTKEGCFLHGLIGLLAELLKNYWMGFNKAWRDAGERANKTH